MFDRVLNTPLIVPRGLLRDVHKIFVTNKNQSQWWKHQNNLSNLFTLNNIDIRTKSTFLLLTLNRFHRLFWSFHCWLWKSKCRLWCRLDKYMSLETNRLNSQASFVTTTITRFFYKPHFHMQHKAEIGKKSRKSYAITWGWNFTFWILCAFFIHDIIQK